MFMLMMKHEGSNDSGYRHCTLRAYLLNYFTRELFYF